MAADFYIVRSGGTCYKDCTIVLPDTEEDLDYDRMSLTLGLALLRLIADHHKIGHVKMRSIDRLSGKEFLEGLLCLRELGEADPGDYRPPRRYRLEKMALWASQNGCDIRWSV